MEPQLPSVGLEEVRHHARRLVDEARGHLVVVASKFRYTLHREVQLRLRPLRVLRERGKNKLFSVAPNLPFNPPPSP